MCNESCYCRGSSYPRKPCIASRPLNEKGGLLDSSDWGKLMQSSLFLYCFNLQINRVVFMNCVDEIINVTYSPLITDVD